MAVHQTGADTETGGPARFEKTHWSVILQAARDPRDTCARDALSRLCEAYWEPLYCWVRRQGYPQHDAEDLTQAFFAQLVAKNTLAHVDPAKGTFRSFLLLCMKNFMISEWRKAVAHKRFPGSPVLSFNTAAAENHCSVLPAHNVSPDILYERECACALLEKAISRLRAIYETKGKLDLYTKLSPSLMGERASVPYVEISQEFHTPESTLRLEVKRMHKELGDILKQILLPVAGSHADLKAELRALLRSFAQ